jgi:hypothetical protein
LEICFIFLLVWAHQPDMTRSDLQPCAPVGPALQRLPLLFLNRRRLPCFRRTRTARNSARHVATSPLHSIPGPKRLPCRMHPDRASFCTASPLLNRPPLTDRAASTRWPQRLLVLSVGSIITPLLPRCNKPMSPRLDCYTSFWVGRTERQVEPRASGTGLLLTASATPCY